MSEDVNKLASQLTERQKELNCLYTVNELFRNSDLPVELLIEKLVETIPTGYQFPHICRVSIELNGEEYSSEDLEKTELKQTALITIDKKEIGAIQVYYIKPVKFDNRPVFLFEEQQLINSIAENLSQYISMQRYKQLLVYNKEISSRLQIPIELSNWLSALHLNENEIEEILLTRVTFSKDDIVFKQGTLVSYVVILTKGMVSIQIEDIQKRGFIYKLIKPYEFIGLSALFGKGVYEYSAKAMLQSEGFLISRETINKVIDQNTKFNSVVLNRISENLSIAYKRMDFLANKQTLGRLSEILLYLWRDVFDEGKIENFITRRIIAELSGMSTENAVRMLSELKNDGIISTSKEGIRILKPQLLETFRYA